VHSNPLWYSFDRRISNHSLLLLDSKAESKVAETNSSLYEPHSVDRHAKKLRTGMHTTIMAGKQRLLTADAQASPSKVVVPSVTMLAASL
jgi:hypothetical protein